MIFASALFRLRLTAAQRLHRASRVIATHPESARTLLQVRERTAPRKRDLHVHSFINPGAIPERREPLQTASFSADSYRQALAEAIAVQGYNIKRKSLPERNVIWVGSGVERLRRSGSVPQTGFVQVLNGNIPSTTKRPRLGIALAQPKRSR
jgi:hypothetical protein